HLHSHAHGTAHEHAHPQGDARRSLGFGLLHGLAGSAAILVLLVAAAPTRVAQVAYFVAFAIGTMIGMLVVSVSLASVVRLASTRGARRATLLHVGSAAASVAVGLLLAGRVAGEFQRSSMLVRLGWLTPLLVLVCLDAFAPAGAVPLT